MTGLVRAAAIVVCLGSAAAASAQPPRPARFDVAGGVRWTPQMKLHEMDADETSASGGRFRLFASETMLDPAASVEGRVGFLLTSILQVGVTGSFAKSRLSTRLSADVENIPDVTARESLMRWTIGGEILADLADWRMGAHTVPFLVAGAGYMRELHQGRILSEQGRFYEFGGGIAVVTQDTPRAPLKRSGLRVDVRAHARSGGVAFDDRVRIAASFVASLFARF
jgi:hypothetical protein